VGKQMSNCWIFKVKEETNGKRVLTGRQIFEHRKGDKAWGLKEFQEDGKRTRNIQHLRKGDRVIFYLCGDEGHCLIGHAILGSEFGASLKSFFHEEYMDL
jgi:hypothetical protein